MYFATVSIIAGIRRIDLTRPYTVENRYPWPAYLIQDDLWFDPKTEWLVGKVK